MKKILTIVAISLAAITVRADYLYWSVGSTETVDGASKTFGKDFNYAALYAYNNGSSIQLAAYSTAFSDMTNLSGYEGYSFYIELINYNAGDTSARLVGSTYNDMKTYTDLAGHIWDGNEIARASVTAFTGTYTATPEPTSGLLLLMGFAMLGLKRKKEV